MAEIVVAYCSSHAPMMKRLCIDPGRSHQLELDHGVMTVHHELDPQLQLSLVPIVQNCAVHPMMPLRRCYEFGVCAGRGDPLL